jgi:hypothetical protein
MEAGDRLAERQAGKQRESRMTGKQHKNGYTDIQTAEAPAERLTERYTNQ